MKTGAPTNAVIAPTGNSRGAIAVRAIRSARVAGRGDNGFGWGSCLYLFVAEELGICPANYANEREYLKGILEVIRGIRGRIDA